VNKVRFGFWGAEEDGLIGAEHYVDSLGKDIKDIALNLNFDMVASPNYVRFVYDGDGSDTGTRGTGGSGTIEGVFLDYFATQGLPTAPTELDGASDYQSFMDVGIPVGGLFTGAEGYDDCYHTPCDNLKNINGQALDEMSDAAAHAVLTFAMTKSDVSGTAKASGKGAEYKGPKLQK
jgi:Zn-dependent M28 family amino/carboxypeptidase